MRLPATIAAAAIIALFSANTLAAEERHDQPHTAPAAAPAVESAIAIGTVTATDEKRHSFTFRADGSDDAFEYRAWYKLADAKAIAEQIKALKVGDRRKVTYTEHEGRRALKIEAITDAAK